MRDRVQEAYQRSLARALAEVEVELSAAEAALATLKAGDEDIPYEDRRRARATMMITAIEYLLDRSSVRVLV